MPTIHVKHRLLERGRVRPGYRLRARSNGRLPVGEIFDPAVLLHLFTYKDPKTGLHSELRTISNISVARDGEANQTVSGVVLDGTAKVGWFERAFTRTYDGRLVVDHVGFEINSDYQGHGFGSRFSDRMERGYRQKGVAAIHVEAAGEVGCYLWARRGFQFALGHDIEFHHPLDAARAARGWWRDLDGKQVAKQLVKEGHWNEQALERLEARFERAVRNPRAKPVTPFEVSEIGRSRPFTRQERRGREERRSWVGRELLLESSWTGIKILNSARYYSL